MSTKCHTQVNHRNAEKRFRSEMRNAGFLTLPSVPLSALYGEQQRSEPYIMDKFPQHVILNIVKHGVSGPKPQLNLLLVCSDFYLAAIPILYHSPRITSLSKFESFFLHDALDLPGDYADLPARELLKEGHTKLVAFRYIHQLYIAMAGGELNRLHGRFLSMTNEQSELYYSAVSKLHALPPNIMPHLESVQIGDLKRHPLDDDGQVDLISADDVGESLLSVGRPRIWCQHSANYLPAEFPKFDPQLWDRIPLPKLYIHTHPQESFPILPGGTTHIYVHADPRGKTQAERSMEEYSDALRYWLASEIASAFENIEEDDFEDVDSGEESEPEEGSEPEEADTREALIKRTRIVISFATGTIKGDGVNDETRQLREIAEGVAALAADEDEDQEDLRDLRIVVKSATEMMPCPACGLKPDDI